MLESNQFDHDYADLDPAEYFKSIEVALDEKGLYVSIDVLDREVPEILSLYTRFAWDVLIEDCVKEIEESSLNGWGQIDPEFDELALELLARLENFSAKVQALRTKHGLPKHEGSRSDART